MEGSSELFSDIQEYANPSQHHNNSTIQKQIILELEVKEHNSDEEIKNQIECHIVRHILPNLAIRFVDLVVNEYQVVLVNEMFGEEHQECKEADKWDKD